MSQPNPPKHLSRSAKAWWRAVTEEFELESHHLRVLQVAAESWDRSEAARQVVASEGLTYTDRFDQPRARPEVTIERDAKISFLRALRELDLDVEPPKPPGRPGGR